MTDLLCKLFIKNKNNTQDPKVREAYGTLAGAVGIVLNFILCFGKFIAGYISGSVAMLADALNNLSDAGSQVISIISFKLSSKPADREHPFGHARTEYVASLAVSFLILLIGFELFKTSLEKIINPERTEFSIISTVILGVAVLLKLWLYVFNRKMAKKINSNVMKATAADSLSDAGATFAVLISSLVLRFFDIDIDAYMGIGVSVLIFIAGINVLNEAKNVIIGEAPDEELVNELKKIAFSHREVLGIHDLMIHSYGAGTTIASFHAEVDGDADVYLVHDAIDNIEKELYEKIGVRCTVHMDPIVTNDEEVLNIRTRVESSVKEINEKFTIHDFRLVKGITHTNLIFDVVVPYEYKAPENEIIDSIDKKIKENFGEEYCTVLTIDKG